MAQKQLFYQWWWWWHRMEDILFSLHYLWIRKFTQEKNISFRLLSPTCFLAVMQVNAVLFSFKPTYTSTLVSFHFTYLHIWGQSLFKWLQWLLQILCSWALSTVWFFFKTGWQIMSINIIFVLMYSRHKHLDLISVVFVEQRVILEQATPDKHTKRKWLQAELIKPTFLLYRLPVPKIQYC
jgi:hypothetical protein